MKTVQFKGATWYWNPFTGFFVLPVGPNRKRERIIKEGSRLFDELYTAAGMGVES